jgi:molybdate-binding protein/DNA-binding XRE family transcriptional regulator
VGRRVEAAELESHVRGKRVAVGLSQAELAQGAGLTRQAVSAVEAGHYVPNTAVALRLAKVLGCGVEELFTLPAQPRQIEAELLSTPASAPPSRVQLSRVGSRLLARPLTGIQGTVTTADGLVAEPGGVPGKMAVDLLVDPRLIDNTIVIAGCDPSLALIGAHLVRRYPSYRLQWIQGGSLSALRALGQGEVHAAGTHLRDPETGEENVPFVRRELPGRRVAIVTLSRWQQGLIVARGNPKGIREGADLLRSDVTIVNREAGSGGRTLLDTRLLAAGGDPATVNGYQRELPSHMAVAEAIAAGSADAGPGIEAAARAFGLDFIPLQEERYDLVIPLDERESAPMQALLEVAMTRRCRDEVEALGGYDSSVVGNVVAELTA